MKQTVLSFLFTLSLTSSAQSIDRFFNALIFNPENISQFIHPEEIKRSGRLGIKYEDVKNKFLISFDIDESVKEKIRSKELTYSIETIILEDNFLKAVFTSENYSKEFYFYYDLFVSPAFYFTNNWKEIDGKYIKVILSSDTLFNEYSLNKLDEYIEAVLTLLKVDEQRKQLLEKEKIIYIHCRDEEEIQIVSGFNTRGIYILAFDEIISTFNTHYHEIAHLLINFKLQSLPLYTLPFLQEGFAVCTGGRGGLSRDVLLDIGFFLHHSDFIPVNSILTKNQFYTEDASLTYPVSGLYNYFLLNSYGIENYLQLYRQLSGSADFISSLALDKIMLPAENKFESFIKNYKLKGDIYLTSDEKDYEIISKGTGYEIFEGENYYKLHVRHNLLLFEENLMQNYFSKKFDEHYPNVEYYGEKYLILASEREVNIYNLYTNNLIASYSSGFSQDNKNVPHENGFFIFYIDKKIFDGHVSSYKQKEI